jgi:hypothetical protein
MKKNKVLFVHIPKTAGTSVRAFLERENLNCWVRNRSSLHHDTFIELKTLNSIQDISNIFAFTICRNPYTRAFSYFNHFNRVNGASASFCEFLSFVKEKKFFHKTPMIQYDQSHYIQNEENEIAKIKIYRFEQLIEFENDFSIKLPKFNSGELSVEEYLNVYKQNLSIDLVKEIYTRDFKNFNYSLNFEDSIVDF